MLAPLEREKMDLGIRTKLTQPLLVRKKLKWKQRRKREITEALLYLKEKTRRNQSKKTMLSTVQVFMKTAKRLKEKRLKMEAMAVRLSSLEYKVD